MVLLKKTKKMERKRFGFLFQFILSWLERKWQSGTQNEKLTRLHRAGDRLFHTSLSTCKQNTTIWTRQISQHNHAKPRHTNIPTAVIDEHAVARPFLEVESEGKSQRFWFFQWPGRETKKTVMSWHHDSILSASVLQRNLTRWTSYCFLL